MAGYLVTLTSCHQVAHREFNASISVLDVLTIRYPDGMVDPLYTLYRQLAVECIHERVSMATAPAHYSCLPIQSRLWK